MGVNKTMDMIGKIKLSYVDSYQEISLPYKAKILSLQEQAGSPCIWALGDFSENWPQKVARVYKLPTGHESYSTQHLEYIGTLQTGPLVWHYFLDRTEDK